MGSSSPWMSRIGFLIRSAWLNGDIFAYTSGACHSVRSSDWNPNGVSVLLYAPDLATAHANRSGACARRFDAMNAPYECPLCAFMKAGPCKVPFTAWEDCLKACEEEGGTDEERQERFVKRCLDQTLKLRDCVDANPEYHGEMFASPSDDDAAADAGADAGADASKPSEDAAN